MNLFLIEARRCLSRRLVWALVGVAVLGIVACAVIVFVTTAREQYATVCEPTADGTDYVCTRTLVPNTFHLVDLWPEEGGDPALAVTVVFLAIGGLLGGASMIGAEWRAGTIGTVLTWEARRVRLAVAKLAASGVLAWLIAMALQVVLVVALVPAAAANGSTEGVDAGWLGNLAAGVFRSGAMTAMAAVVGASVAMLGRNTAAAFGAAFAYMMIGENVVRAWRPWLRPWLLGENSVIFITAERLSDPVVGRGFATATLTLVAYVVGLAALAVASFRLRDIAAS